MFLIKKLSGFHLRRKVIVFNFYAKKLAWKTHAMFSSNQNEVWKQPPLAHKRFPARYVSCMLLLWDFFIGSMCFLCPLWLATVITFGLVLRHNWNLLYKNNVDKIKEKICSKPQFSLKSSSWLAPVSLLLVLSTDLTVCHQSNTCKVAITSCQGLLNTTVRIKCFAQNTTK